MNKMIKLNDVLINWNTDNMPDDSDILSAKDIDLYTPRTFIKKMEKYGLSPQFWNSWAMISVPPNDSCYNLNELFDNFYFSSAKIENGLVTGEDWTTRLSEIEDNKTLYNLINNVINEYNIDFNFYKDSIFLTNTKLGIWDTKYSAESCIPIITGTLKNLIEMNNINQKENILNISLYYNETLYSDVEEKNSTWIDPAIWEGENEDDNYNVEDENEVYHIEDIELWSIENGEFFIMKIPNLFEYDDECVMDEYFYGIMFPKKYKRILKELRGYILGK